MCKAGAGENVAVNEIEWRLHASIGVDSNRMDIGRDGLDIEANFSISQRLSLFLHRTPRDQNVPVRAQSVSSSDRLLPLHPPAVELPLLRPSKWSQFLLRPSPIAHVVRILVGFR